MEATARTRARENTIGNFTAENISDSGGFTDFGASAQYLGRRAIWAVLSFSLSTWVDDGTYIFVKCLRYEKIGIVG